MTRIQRIISPAFAVVFAMMLSACGFQLRGSIDVTSDIKSLAVQSVDRNFQRILNSTLEIAGITLSEKAPYLVNVVSLEQEEVASSSSGGSIVSDYTVTATLQWQLKNEDGLVLLDESLVRKGNYRIESDNYNAGQKEKTRLLEELQQTLATALTLRVANLSNQQLLEMEQNAESATTL